MIGLRIREFRAANGLTLRALSDRTGLSPSMLSLVERGKASPSIGSLIVICSALGVHMTDILSPRGPSGRGPVSRASQQPVVETAKGVQRRILTEEKSRGIDIALNEYAPRTGSAETPVRHSGFEFGIVLDGELTVTLNGVAYVLAPGDLISYESSSNHRIWNNGRERARAIWINLSGS